MLLDGSKSADIDHTRLAFSSRARALSGELSAGERRRVCRQMISWPCRRALLAPVGLQRAVSCAQGASVPA